MGLLLGFGFGLGCRARLELLLLLAQPGHLLLALEQAVVRHLQGRQVGGPPQLQLL